MNDETLEGKVERIIDGVQEMFPLTCEFQEDAREVWPKRWGAICNELRHAIMDKQEGL